MMKDKAKPVYSVLSRKGTLGQLREYAHGAREIELFQKAYTNLENYDIDYLIKRHIVLSIGNDYYLYRVGFRNRLIFKQDQYNRYIVAVGNPDQIKRHAYRLKSSLMP
jgi:hypothetical protein